MIGLGPKQYENSVNIEREELIKKAAYGLNDGILSISALLAVFLGMGQRPTSILQILIAATLAGALSLSIGEFISTRMAKEDFLQEEHDARMEVTLVPELKKREIRKIYKYKGFKGDFLDEIVDHIAMDEDWLVRELALDEVALAETQKESELKNAGIIFLAFLIGALFPLFPYAIALGVKTPDYDVVLIFAIIVIALGFLGAGALKMYVTKVNWSKSGFQMLALGLLLFAVSYLLGLFLGVIFV